MHELGLAESIVRIVREHVPEPDLRRVRVVRVRVGALAGVVVDSLDFCFGAIVAGTSLAAARLEFERIDARARCRRCGGEARSAEPLWLCGGCGAGELELLAGRELAVAELELDDAVCEAV